MRFGIMIGAGSTALAAETFCLYRLSQILILEKASTHNSAIRQRL